MPDRSVLTLCVGFFKYIDMTLGSCRTWQTLMTKIHQQSKGQNFTWALEVSEKYIKEYFKDAEAPERHKG